MSPLRAVLAVAAAAAVAAAVAAPAQAQLTTISFNAVPNAAAPGAFATASGYTFTNFSTLETNSPFGTGNNGAGARFAYVPLFQGFGSVRRESRDFYLRSALLSFRAFDGNTSGPLTVTINGYQGLNPAADPVFTQTVQLTNDATLFNFSTIGLTEIEFLTDGLQLGGRQAVLAVDNLALASVPEPTTVVLFGAGAVTLAGVAARRRRAA